MSIAAQKQENWEDLIAKIKKAKKELRKKKKAQGKEPEEKTTHNNTKCQHETVQEAQKEQLDIIKEHLKVYQKIFPDLIKGFKEIKDPRNPNKTEHKLISAFLYGMFLFILKIPSRRQANKILTRPQFIENLNTIFPELEEVEDLPHGDTVNNILQKISVEKIQDLHVKIVKSLLKNKTFEKYKTTNGYIINVDGTRKFSSNYPFSKEALEREIETKQGKKREYYVYILEANIVFEGGLSIPLLTEFCEFSKGRFENNKQDCELKAFKRLASRLKGYFSHLPIGLNLDGLYPRGPVFRICRKNHWSFMITLKDKDLAQIWEEAEGRRKLLKNNTFKDIAGDREQHFWWVNELEYRYGNNGQYKETVHLVVCIETWEEVNNEGEIVEKSQKFAWISSKPLHKHNVTIRCNKIGRPRWLIEEDILVEKHHGYYAKHLYSTDWKAMKAFHYLMRMVRLLDVLCHYSVVLYEKIQSMGVRGLVNIFITTLTATVINNNKIAKFLQDRHYMQLVNL